jgi:hypothetical protein
MRYNVYCQKASIKRKLVRTKGEDITLIKIELLQYLICSYSNHMANKNDGYFI